MKKEEKTVASAWQKGFKFIIFEQRDWWHRGMSPRAWRIKAHTAHVTEDLLPVTLMMRVLEMCFL